MIGVLLPFILGVALLAIVRLSGESNRRVLGLFLLGYAIRFAIHIVNRNVQFFSHDIGGDALEYETWARAIATVWQQHGIHYVSAAEFPELGPTSLPPNLFAFVIFLNDGPTDAGCLSLVAFAAALAVLNVYKIAIQFGALQRDALMISMLLYFGPTFLFYTSDTYKDGLVVCLTVGALASTLRLIERLTILHAVIGVACVACLWYVRFYLVFVTVAPLLVGLVGLRARTIARPLIAALTLTAAAVALAAFTDFLQVASERAAHTFEVGTTVMVQDNAVSGGSSVEFDDGGSPFGAFGPKLLYTLFSPFPWSSGSLGFQLGKLDALVWYFLMYRALRGLRVTHLRIGISLLTFIVPCTIMYATSMANVGLIVRQRLVIVFAAAIVATFRPQSHRLLPARTNRPTSLRTPSAQPDA